MTSINEETSRPPEKPAAAGDAPTEKVAATPGKSSETSPEKTKKSWSILNQELKDALNTWEVLSEEVSTKISPEEQQLQEVKRLLTELKDKLKQFSE